jgi:hypothetical protein
MINNINNGESGLSARNKINQIIDTVNLGITTGATLVGDVIYFNTNNQQNAYSVDLSSLSPTVTGITTSAVLSGNTLYFNTNEQQNAYSADLGGLRSYSDLGFTIITTSATTLNQSVVLPEGVVVTYNSPLIVGPGVTVTVPESTTLIIVTGSTY